MFSALDDDITLMKGRKTMAIKSDNVQAAILQNANAITESLQMFQTLAEKSGDDLAVQYAATKENYENQIQKLKDRLVKQKKQHSELSKL